MSRLDSPQSNHEGARKSRGRSIATSVSIATMLAVLLFTAAPALADESGSMDESTEADVAARTEIETTGFIYQEITVDESSARAGAGQQVSLGGHSVSLLGDEIKVGDKLRPATLKSPSMQKVALTGGTGRIRVLSIVPSLKTKTCEQQTHYLSEKSEDLGERVELVTISVDSPQTQGQFAEEAEISNVTFLSDAGDASCGKAHGLLMEKPPILTRAVLVVDGDNVVRYLQVVPEVSHMPDMEAAFAAARDLATPSSPM